MSDEHCIYRKAQTSARHFFFGTPYGVTLTAQSAEPYGLYISYLFQQSLLDDLFAGNLDRYSNEKKVMAIDLLNERMKKLSSNDESKVLSKEQSSAVLLSAIRLKSQSDDGSGAPWFVPLTPLCAKLTVPGTQSKERVEYDHEYDQNNPQKVEKYLIYIRNQIGKRINFAFPVQMLAYKGLLLSHLKMLTSINEEWRRFFKKIQEVYNDTSKNIDVFAKMSVSVNIEEKEVEVSCFPRDISDSQIESFLIGNKDYHTSTEIEQNMALLASEDGLFTSSPSNDFLMSVEKLLAYKKETPIRLWTAMVESYFRLAVFADVAWGGNLTCALWSSLKEAKQRGEDATTFIRSFKNTSLKQPNFQIGVQFQHQFCSLLKDYYEDSLLLYYLCISKDVQVSSLLTENGLKEFFNCIEIEDIDNVRTKVKEFYENVHTIEGKLIRKAKDGLPTAYFEGNNSLWSQKIYQFAQSILEPVHTYDEGYWIRKETKDGVPFDKQSRKVSFGIVSWITIIALSTTPEQQRVTITEIIEKLNQYGFNADVADFKSSHIAKKLRDLNLIVESSDAGGGIIFRNWVAIENKE